MSQSVRQEQPTQTPPQIDELRAALAYVTGASDKLFDASVDSTIWLWEAIQGDFNQDRSTGQIAFDAAVSMIPLVDQVCDLRDLIANCKEIQKDQSNTWAWVSLGLTLIGLFPVLGSLVKGVLKVFFLFIRRSGSYVMGEAVEQAMTWVITLLRKREVMRYWRGLKWGQVFKTLAEQIQKVRDKVELAPLLTAFDRGIAKVHALQDKFIYVPRIGAQLKQTLEMLKSVRQAADQQLAKAVKPLQDALDAIIRRLELEQLGAHRVVLNTVNVHFRGGLPEARAVALMRKADPEPTWLSRGKPGEFEALKSGTFLNKVEEKAALGFPRLTPDEIKTFSRSLEAVELKGPQRLYRVISPSSRASASDWVTEEVFKQLSAAADPKAAWRKHLAVWPDWNPNGQFVVYELKAGETLKAWKGPAASQVKPKKFDMPDRYLEGGFEQVKFDGSQLRNASGESLGDAGDTMSYFKVNRSTGEMKADPEMTYAKFKTLSPEQKAHYECLREKINHPSIHGPFDTGWGMTDFDAQLTDVRLGLPNLPGLITEIKK